MAKGIVADTCFWYALFNERDEHHANALQIEEDIVNFDILIPWPTLYETINTRFIKKEKNRQAFKRYLDKASTSKISLRFDRRG